MTEWHPGAGRFGKVREGWGAKAVNTYLSSWEFAAMRDLRVLSANGHPETLKRQKKTELTLTNQTPLAFWDCKHVTGDWGKVTGSRSDFVSLTWVFQLFRIESDLLFIKRRVFPARQPKSGVQWNSDIDIEHVPCCTDRWWWLEYFSQCPQESKSNQ